MTIFIQITNEPYDPQLQTPAAYISSPYEAKNVIKELPKRRWDKTRRRWVIPVTDIDLALKALRHVGYHVEVLGRPETPPAPSNRDQRTWADLMFMALPERFHTAAFTALSKILHPDIGGDTSAMQALNTARDKHWRVS